MTTNHKPVTPLPWSYSRRGSVGDFRITGGVFLSGEAQTPKVAGIAFDVYHEQDAAYIAHAANAYPKLVEALRELQALCDALAFRPPVDDSRAVDRDTRNLRAGLEAPRALLRELGEQA